MGMVKKVINKERIRRIGGSFSWIDHAFITRGFIKDLKSREILLYLFLVTVGDRYGLSFYGEARICGLLKIEMASLCNARAGLVKKGLIEYRDRIYQVLDLPAGVFTDVSAPSKGGVSSLADVLKETLRHEGGLR